MSTYKTIRGFTIENVATNPAVVDSGQLWYNSTEGVFKAALGVSGGAFSTKPAMLTTSQGGAGAGTGSSAIRFGGDNNPTQIWNDTAWTTSPSMDANRNYLGGCGTSNTSAIAMGGPYYNNGSKTEVYNGSWTVVNNMNTVRSRTPGGGTATSAVIYGGLAGNPPQSSSATAESWNGSSWTTSPSLNQARYGMGGCGTSNTSVLACGGSDPSSPPTQFEGKANVESYNGSWTNVNQLNQVANGTTALGTTTSALKTGGGFPGSNGPPNQYLQSTESWNGSSWTTVSPLNVGRYNLMSSSGAGNQNGIVFGGRIQDSTSFVEKWEAPGITIKTVKNK